MKHVITTVVALTAPVWVIPVAVGIVLVFLYLEIHNMLWGRKW